MPSRRPALARLAALALAAAALAFLVGRDGSPWWRVFRVAEVILLAGVAAAMVLALGPRGRAAALLLVGTAGLAAGLGITPAWATRAGPSVVTLAGIAALVGGGAALAYGLIDLGRPAGGWRRWAAVVLALLACGVLFLSGAIAVAATNVPPTRLGPETPADRGLAFEEAGFATEDGVSLSGWYLPSANGAAVVLLHGSGSTRSAVLDHAVLLARHGYGVLLFDARGHGRSGGRAMDFGWFGDADVTAALDYLARRPDVDPRRIGAVGLSMGGEQAIGAAAADGRLRAVVAEGATGRTAADRAWLPQVYGFNGGVQRAVDALVYWFADLFTSAGPPLSLREAVISMAPRPALLIAAGEAADERLVAAYLQAAAPGNVQVWEAPGAGHTAGLATLPEEWAQRVLGFLDHHLGPRAGN